MEFIPLSDALGVEVRGFDASQPPSAAELAALTQAFRDHHLLLFRGQSLGQQAQEQFIGNFGPLIDEVGNGRFSGFISNVEMLDGGGGSGVLPFHSDFSFTRSPVHGIALYPTALPDGGTETLFASSAHAAATLPADLRTRIGGRSAHHVLPVSTNKREFKARDLDEIGSDPEIVRPILFEHPRNGQEVLYVTDLHTHSVEGLDRAESDQLLEELFEHLYADDNVYVHHWELGDLVVWDNVALQHARGDVSQGGERTFRRTSLNEFTIMELLPALMTIGTDNSSPHHPTRETRMAASTVLIRRPTAPKAPDVSAPSYTIDKPLAGLTIGLRTDTAWRSWRIIAENWKQKLEAGGAKTIQVDAGGQTGNGRKRDKKKIEDFAGQVDGAFVGLGTCGSCTSYTITDAVEVEDQAKASVAVVTTEFETHGHNVANFLGHRDLKVLVMPYPLEALPEDELNEIAEKYWPQALDLLGIKPA